MSEIVVNHPKTTCSAFGYFVLSFCLLVPTIGTIALFVVLDYLSNERLALGGAICIYLSSVILGLFSVKSFRKYSGRADLWALIVGIALSGICGLATAGALIFSNVAAALNIH
jgi:hypothetical protein